MQVKQLIKVTLLERDFNIPAVPVLLKEVQQIADTQERWQDSQAARLKVKA